MYGVWHYPMRFEGGSYVWFSWRDPPAVFVPYPDQEAARRRALRQLRARRARR